MSATKPIQFSQWTACLHLAAKTASWPAFDGGRVRLVTVLPNGDRPSTVHELSLKQIIDISTVCLRRNKVSPVEKAFISRNLKILLEGKKTEYTQALCSIKNDTLKADHLIIKIVKKIQNYFKTREIKEQLRLIEKAEKLCVKTDQKIGSNIDSETRAQAFRQIASLSLNGITIDPKTILNSMEQFFGDYAQRQESEPAGLAFPPADLLSVFRQDNLERVPNTLILSSDNKQTVYTPTEDIPVRQASFNVIFARMREAVSTEKNEERRKQWLEVLQILPTQGGVSTLGGLIRMPFEDAVIGKQNAKNIPNYKPQLISQINTLQVYKKADGEIEKIEPKTFFTLQLNDDEKELGLIRIKISFELRLDEKHKPMIDNVSIQMIDTIPIQKQPEQA